MKGPAAAPGRSRDGSLLDDRDVVVRECGTRRQGCDESPGWVWHAARCLDVHLDASLGGYLRWCRRQRGAERRGASAEAAAVDPAGAGSIKGVEGTPGADEPCAPEERQEGCWKGLRVLELGSGTGWLALRLASRGAAVTATDRPGAVPLLAQNVVRNQEFLRSMERRGDHDGTVDHTGESWNVQVRALDWESAMPDGWSESDRGPQRGGVEDDVGADGATRTDDKWDVILATDILYLHESHRPLLATIRKHSRALCGSAAQAAEMPTLVVIGWEQRHPAEEADFRALAADMGLAGMPGTPREIGTNPVTGKTVWVAVWTVV